MLSIYPRKSKNSVINNNNYRISTSLNLGIVEFHLEDSVASLLDRDNSIIGKAIVIHGGIFFL